MSTKLERAESAIEKTLDNSPIFAYRQHQLADILRAHREEWRLPKSIGVKKFISFLLESSKLREVEIQAEHYEQSESRYVWGEPSAYGIALSLRNDSYLTHGSAVFLHALTDEIPKTIYVNYEQSPKKPSAGELTQAGIDRAFANRQRQSNLTYRCDDYQIVLVNGKCTGRLEVGEIRGEKEELLEVTKIERTLIDITVRPVYAGGIYQVLKAFRGAKEKASANVLLATLKKLSYIYPYHQAIGFYMERAGYPESKWGKLFNLGLHFDFYLAHNIPASQRQYDKRWRLYYPKGL
jgi:hypothetical protein